MFTLTYFSFFRTFQLCVAFCAISHRFCNEFSQCTFTENVSSICKYIKQLPSLYFTLLCCSFSLYICVRACVSVCVFIDISVFYISGYFWSITQIPVNEVSLRVSLHHPAICSNWTHRLTHKKRYIEHGRLTSTYASLLCLRFDSGAEENGILWVVHREHVAEVLYDGITARCNTKRMNIVCGM